MLTFELLGCLREVFFCWGIVVKKISWHDVAPFPANGQIEPVVPFLAAFLRRAYALVAPSLPCARLGLICVYGYSARQHWTA